MELKSFCVGDVIALLDRAMLGFHLEVVVREKLQELLGHVGARG